MRPAILVLLFAIGSAVPARAGQPPARPATPAAPDAARTGSTTEDPAYYFILGRYLEGEGKLDEAIAAHKQAIALAPASAELRAELAGLYARNDRAKEALETAQAALEKDTDNQEANKILGTIYAALSDQRQPLQPGDNPADYPKRAIIALEKARPEGLFDINIDLMLGRLYAQTGAYEKALPLLRHVVDDQPGYQEGALLLAATEESAGRPADAIETLEETLRFNPDFYRGQLRLAETYERARRWADAADAFGRAQALNTRNTALVARRALALINAGKAAEARGHPRTGRERIRHAGCRDDVPPRRGAAGRSRSRVRREHDAQAPGRAPGRCPWPSRAVLYPAGARRREGGRRRPFAIS